MRYKDVCIESFGYVIPEDIITSLSLEERLSPVYDRLNLAYGRLEMMTGIRERRFWLNGDPPSQTGAMAAKKAIANSGIEKDDIECILHTSLSRDFLEPATAFLVHDSLGLPSTATIFDISNACLGFVNGMVSLANMIELGQVKAGIVVASESSRHITDTTIDEILQDPEMTRAKLKLSFASLTLGSGSVAVIMTHSSLSSSNHRLLGGVIRTASQYNGLCRIEDNTYFYKPNSRPTMHTDYQGILDNGLQLAEKTWKALNNELEWQNSDVDKVFCHQVSVVHQSQLFDRLDFCSAKGFSSVEYLGNIGPVSLPITLAISEDKGHLNTEDRVALLGIGSGLSSIMLGVKW
ncbi:MAG: 3-oxoacyl-ACP synthase III [Thermodesulfobacteriota bacterium]|nr:3-oxoacyl-ACP synthase III [Thermodesulfobacteriota bacterium]